MEIKYKYVKKGFSLFVKEQRESLLFFYGCLGLPIIPGKMFGSPGNNGGGKPGNCPPGNGGYGLGGCGG